MAKATKKKPGPKPGPKQKKLPRKRSKALTRNPRGKKPTITDAIVAQVLAALAHGATFDTALAYAGVAERTGAYWLTRGRSLIKAREERPTMRLRREDARYISLVAGMDQAVAKAEVRDLEKISAAADLGDWKASAWRLERRNPERWGRKLLKVEGDITHHVTHADLVMQSLPEDERKRIEGDSDAIEAQFDVESS